MQHWIPFVILQYMVVAFLTQRNNSEPGYLLLVWLAGALPMWPLISRYSRDVVYDGLVFDICMTVSYTLAVIFFTKTFYKFGIEQIIGVAFILFGLFFFKWGI